MVFFFFGPIFQTRKKKATRPIIDPQILYFKPTRTNEATSLLLSFSYKILGLGEQVIAALVEYHVID